MFLLALPLITISRTILPVLLGFGGPTSSAITAVRSVSALGLLVTVGVFGSGPRVATVSGPSVWIGREIPGREEWHSRAK